MSSSTAPSQNRPAPRVRRATSADKEGYVSVILSGYEVDLQFRWRYPRRHEFPEDARKASGGVFDRVLALENATPFVAELPRIKEGESDFARSEADAEWVIVAVAVWEWKNWEEVENESAPSGFSSPTSGRRDMDPARQKQFIDAITAAEKQYFGSSWGPKRLELSDMAADPRYHRRGAGKALMEVGLAMAREARVPIMLTSSPLGTLLYLKMGFEQMGYEECGFSEEEKEKVGFGVMVWKPEGWERDSVTHGS